MKKRILIPKVKNKEGEAVKTRTGIANVFANFSRRFVRRWRGLQRRRHGLVHWTRQGWSQPTQLHSRVYNEWDPRCHRPIENRESERQQWNTSWAIKKLQRWYERKDKDNIQWNCTTGGLHTKKLAKDPYQGHLPRRWQRGPRQL